MIVLRKEREHRLSFLLILRVVSRGGGARNVTARLNISSSGDRIDNQSRLQSKFLPLRHDWSLY